MVHLAFLQFWGFRGLAFLRVRSNCIVESRVSIVGILNISLGQEQACCSIAVPTMFGLTVGASLITAYSIMGPKTLF